MADNIVAIDVWSTGMILAFFLSCKFPLFNSNDDVEALMEIACIIGRKKMEKVATLHSKWLTHPTSTLRRSYLRRRPDILYEYPFAG